MKGREGSGSTKLTIGIGLADRLSDYCVLDESWEVMAREVIETRREELERLFRRIPPSRIAIEVETHSPWVSRLLEGYDIRRS